MKNTSSKGINIGIKKFSRVGSHKGFPCGSADKEFACNVGDLGLIPGLGRCPGEGKGYPLQYSGQENSMDCIIHRATKSWTWLSKFHSLTQSRRQWGTKLVIRKKTQILWYGKGGNGMEEVEQVLCVDDELIKGKLGFTEGNLRQQRKSKCCIRLCF